MGKDRIRPFSEDISTGSFAETEHFDPRIEYSRKAVVLDLLRQGLTPEGIRDILTTEEKSDWKISEIRKILIELGMPKSKLWKLGSYEEIKLNLGSKEWQDIRKEIARWKKSGGTLHAKLKGSKEKEEHKKNIEILIAERGPKLTSNEMDEIAATPGIIPPWWVGFAKDGYYDGATKAIKELGVSAIDVHLATERDYTDKPLTEKEEEILQAGWGIAKKAEPNVIPQGEFYHKDKGWY